MYHEVDHFALEHAFPKGTEVGHALPKSVCGDSFSSLRSRARLPLDSMCGAGQSFHIVPQRWEKLRSILSNGDISL